MQQTKTVDESSQFYPPKSNFDEKPETRIDA